MALSCVRANMCLQAKAGFCVISLRENPAMQLAQRGNVATACRLASANGNVGSQGVPTEITHEALRVEQARIVGSNSGE